MRTDLVHIEALLPALFRRTLREGEPLSALLEAMLALQMPSESVLLVLDSLFDPRRAPDEWVPHLARWVGIDLEITTGIGRLRELTAVAVELAQRRGTLSGLLQFLEIATGITGFQIDDRVLAEDGTERAFHIRVRIPQAAAPHLDMIEQIVMREKPAYVTCDMSLASGLQGPS